MKPHAPSPAIAFRPAKLVIISGGLAAKVPLPDVRQLLRIERYLARQARAAQNLGVPVLEHYYLVSYLALRLWRMERFEASNYTVSD